MQLVKIILNLLEFLPPQVVYVAQLGLSLHLHLPLESQMVGALVFSEAQHLFYFKRSQLICGNEIVLGVFEDALGAETLLALSISAIVLNSIIRMLFTEFS